MTAAEIFEALMLGAFSVGWYWSIFAMIWTGRPYGKNIAFVACTVAGYGFGLTSKLLMWHAGDPFGYLIILYSWNLFMTVVDICLFIKLSRRSTILQNLRQHSVPANEKATSCG